MRAAIGAAICAGISLLALCAPAGARAEGGMPIEQSGMFSGGGRFVLRRDPAAATAAIELWFRAPDAGYDLRSPGISRLAIAAVAASAPQHGSSLRQLILNDGGRLALATYPDIATVSATVPANDAVAVLRAMTAAYFAPSISAGAYRAALQDATIAAAESHYDAERTLQDTLFSRLFVAGPNHYAPVPDTASAFARIPSAAVQSFASRAFTRRNAIVTLAGNVDAGVLSAVAAHPGGAAENAPIDSTPTQTPPAPLREPAPEAALGFAWLGPPIEQMRSATALDFVADYLFDAQYGKLARELRASHPDLYVNGQFITLHDPGVLLVTVSGTGSAQLRQQILNAIDVMRRPLDPHAFDAAKNAFLYHILTQTQTPAERADNFGWYSVQGEPAYAPGDDSGTYVKTADSLDANFVAETVRRYLQQPAIVELSAQTHPIQGAAI